MPKTKCPTATATVEEAPPAPAAETPTPPPTAPDLLQVEAAHQQHKWRRAGAALKGAIEVVPGCGNYVDRLSAADALLDAQKTAPAAEPDADPLQHQLDLAQLAYHVAVGKVAKVQASAASLTTERQKLQEALAEAEQAIVEAAADEKAAALTFAVTGSSALVAARVRQERATARRDEARKELQTVADALAAVTPEIERTRHAMASAANALWEVIARLRFRDAAPGLKALAESWAARTRSGSTVTTLPEFLMMAFRQHLPTPEAGAAIERRLKEKFFTE